MRVFDCAVCGTTRREGRWHPALACWWKARHRMRRNGGLFAYQERWVNELPPDQVVDLRRNDST